MGSRLHTPELHSPERGFEKRPSWLEMFCDLLFVAAFLALGMGLSRGGGAGVLLLFGLWFVTVWSLWLGSVAFANRFNVDGLGHRTLLLLQMAAVVGIAVAAPRAFGGDARGLHVAGGVAQLLCAAMFLRTALQVPESRGYCRTFGLAFLLGAAANLVAPTLPTKLTPLLVLANLPAAFVPLSPQSRRLLQEHPHDQQHLGERFGLLILFTLGASTLKILSGLALTESLGLSLLGAAATLLLAASLWWIYFDDVAGARLRAGHGQGMVWLYGHAPLQLGILAFAVGVERVLAKSLNDPAAPHGAALLTGSLSLIYLSVAALDSVTERRQAELSDRARINFRALSGIFVLALLPAARPLSALQYLGVIVAMAVLQVGLDLIISPQGDAPERAALRSTSTADLARRSREAGSAVPSIRTGAREILRKGTPSDLRRDVYFYLMEGSFWRVLAAFVGLFFLVNVFFAALFLAEPGAISGARPGSLSDAFFFSVQTMSTIGDGTMSPQTEWGHWIVTAEAAISLIGVAVVTGLVFARLS